MKVCKTLSLGIGIFALLQAASATAGCEKPLLAAAEHLRKEHDLDKPVTTFFKKGAATVFSAGIALPFLIEERIEAKRNYKGYIYLAQVIREAGETTEKPGPWILRFTKDVNEISKEFGVEMTTEEVALEIVRMDRNDAFCESKKLSTAKDAANKIGGAIF